MKVEDIKQIARQHNIKLTKATKTDLVRAIQQAEGNRSCFSSSNALQCGEQNCLWRADCV